MSCCAWTSCRTMLGDPETAHSRLVVYHAANPPPFSVSAVMAEYRLRSLRSGARGLRSTPLVDYVQQSSRLHQDSSRLMFLFAVVRRLLDCCSNVLLWIRQNGCSR